MKLPDYRVLNPDMTKGFLDSVIEIVENVINVISHNLRVHQWLELLLSKLLWVDGLGKL